MGEEMIILAYQMLIKQQGDTVMENSDLFPEGVEQNISRRENGVLKTLYKVLEKPKMNWWASFWSNRLKKGEFKPAEVHRQTALMPGEQKFLLWHCSHDHPAMWDYGKTLALLSLIQWSFSPNRNCVFQPSRIRVALLEIHGRVSTEQLKFLHKPIRGHISQESKRAWGPSHGKGGGLKTDPPGSVVARHIQFQQVCREDNIIWLPDLFHLEGSFPILQSPITTKKKKLQH